MSLPLLALVRLPWISFGGVQSFARYGIRTRGDESPGSLAKNRVLRVRRSNCWRSGGGRSQQTAEPEADLQGKR